MDLGAAVTLTSRRAQQVEQVFRKNGLWPKTYLGIEEFEEAERKCQNAVIDLLALQPTPSRERLRELLFDLLHQDHLTNGVLTTYGENALMTWATGEAGRPTWCEHIKWDEERKMWFHPTPAFGANAMVPTAESWDICPVTGCHAPRPGAG